MMSMAYLQFVVNKVPITMLIFLHLWRLTFHANIFFLYLCTDVDALEQASLLASSASTRTGVLTDEQTLSLTDELLDVQTNPLKDDNMEFSQMYMTLYDQPHSNSPTINVLEKESQSWKVKFIR